jgi:hypothetical protein
LGAPEFVSAAGANGAAGGSRWEAARPRFQSWRRTGCEEASEIVAMPSMTLRIVPLAAMDRPALDPKTVLAAALRFPPDSQVRVQSDSDERQWWSYGLPLIQTENNPETRWRTRRSTRPD